MRVALAVIVACALTPLASAQEDGTFWNYPWFGADTEGGSVRVYRESCAGYGFPIPGNDTVGFLLPWSSLPDPAHDCDPETRVGLFVLP